MTVIKAALKVTWLKGAFFIRRRKVWLPVLSREWFAVDVQREGEYCNMLPPVDDSEKHGVGTYKATPWNE